MPDCAMQMPVGPMNAVLPLYINPSHWMVARQKLKPILGWACTLNVLGYEFKQVLTAGSTC